MVKGHHRNASSRISSMYQSSDQGYPVYPSHETTIQINNFSTCWDVNIHFSSLKMVYLLFYKAHRKEDSQNSSLNIGSLLLCLNAHLPMSSLFLMVLLLWDHSYNLLLGQIQVSSLNQSPTSVPTGSIQSLFPLLACFPFHSSVNFLFKCLLRVLEIILRRNKYTECQSKLG